MDTKAALCLSQQMGQLIHLCAGFQAIFGRGYRLKPDSPRAAWMTHEAILRQQVSIAESLDPAALHQPRKIINKWWERLDVPDLSSVTELMSETSRLIATCTYVEADPSADWSYAILCAQTVIAGMLHPAAVQIALGNVETRTPYAV